MTLAWTKHTLTHILNTFTEVQDYKKRIIPQNFHVIGKRSGRLEVISTYGPWILLVCPSHVYNMFLICLTGGFLLIYGSCRLLTHFHRGSVVLIFNPNVFSLVLLINLCKSVRGFSLSMCLWMLWLCVFAVCENLCHCQCVLCIRYLTQKSGWLSN